MNQYDGILIHPDVKGGRISGIILIKNNGIYFQSSEINYDIQNNNLIIDAGGASNRLIFFKTKLSNDISIYTQNKKILKDSFLVSNPNFSKDIKKSKSILRKTLNGILIFSSLFLLFTIGLYLLKDRMIEGVANKIPAEWEQEAGDKLFKTVSLDYKFIDNDSLKKEFIKVAQPVINQAKKEGYKIDLYFVNDPTINAFALPGGKVIIQSGLINNAKSWEEVMGVLSHEISHVTRRHHVRGILNNIGVYAILSAAIGDVSAIAGTFASMGGELAVLSNSRDFENEADEKGFEYMKNAHYNPQGMITFFETIEKEHQKSKKVIDSVVGKTDDVDLSFLSTHPDTKERIAHLKEKIKSENVKYSVISSDFKAFKNRMNIVIK